MDPLQRGYLLVAAAVLVFTVLKWIRLLRRLDAAVQAAREAARSSAESRPMRSA